MIIKNKKRGLGIWVVIYQDGRQGYKQIANYDERDLFHDEIVTVPLSFLRKQTREEN